MTARSFLVRGLLVGLLAGFATFLVAHQVGEPSINTAIAIEEAHESAGPSHHEESGPEVSRETQSTWGLLTGTLAVSIALGGILALVAAGTLGRLGRLTAAQSTAVVSLIGFTAFAFVPFLKYPANPPSVGSGDTIGERTGYYFLFVLISLVVAVLATAVTLKVSKTRGTYVGLLAGVGLYLLVVVTAGQLLPTVNEVGDFPADTLWFFRRASLITLATMWAIIGFALSGLVGRLADQTRAQTERRAFAASL